MQILNVDYAEHEYEFVENEIPELVFHVLQFESELRLVETCRI